MSYSREGKFSSDLVLAMEQLDDCAFRKISDRFQVGVSDIVGCFRGWYAGLECKHVYEVVGTKITLKRTFTGAQVEELKRIRDCGGIAYGVVACGQRAWVFEPSAITADTTVLDTSNAVFEFTLPNVIPFARFLDGVQKARHRS